MIPDLTMGRIRKGAFILMILVAAELVYYTWKSFRRAYRFSFGEPDRWNMHRLVDEGTMIEFVPRLGYFTFWSVVILASVAAFVVGLILLNRCRKGLVFEEGTAEIIRTLGFVLAFAMVIDQIFQAMDAWLLSRFNADGPYPIQWFYDPSDIKTFIMAVILILFGWVMRSSIQIERENRGYI